MLIAPRVLVQRVKLKPSNSSLLLVERAFPFGHSCLSPEIHTPPLTGWWNFLTYWRRQIWNAIKVSKKWERTTCCCIYSKTLSISRLFDTCKLANPNGTNAGFLMSDGQLKLSTWDWDLRGRKIRPRSDQQVAKKRFIGIFFFEKQCVKKPWLGKWRSSPGLSGVRLIEMPINRRKLTLRF